jgi:hypothetical protein
MGGHSLRHHGAGRGLRIRVFPTPHRRIAVPSLSKGKVHTHTHTHTHTHKWNEEHTPPATCKHGLLGTRTHAVVIGQPPPQSPGYACPDNGQMSPTMQHRPAALQQQGGQHPPYHPGRRRPSCPCPKSLTWHPLGRSGGWGRREGEPRASLAARICVHLSLWLECPMTKIRTTCGVQSTQGRWHVPGPAGGCDGRGLEVGDAPKYPSHLAHICHRRTRSHLPTGTRHRLG